MSDKKPPETNVDRLRRRMAGALDVVSTVETPRVVDIHTRQEVQAARQPRRKKVLKNPALIEYLRGLLIDARAGDITSMSLIVSGPKVPFATNVLIMGEVGSDDVAETALKHVGALSFLEETLKDVTVGFDPQMLEDMGIDEEGFFPE